MKQRTVLSAVVGLLVVVAAACGNAAASTDSDEASNGTGGGPAAGMCHVDAPDCVDTGVGGEGPIDAGDDFPTDSARQEARGVLGMNEGDLPDDVRVSRRGDEQMMLTEDYVLGRRTVELDDLEGKGYRVVSVRVELPDGPETFELEAS
jgi:hypothetical protein